MTRIVALRVLEDREACEKAFDIQIDAQNVIETMEFLTNAAIRGDEEFVRVPTPWAAAAVLMLKGEVKRPPHHPRNTAWRKQKEKQRRFHDLLTGKRKRKSVDATMVEMVAWVRQRLRELKREAKASGTRIAADDLRLRAAAEAREKFKSKKSVTDIADKSRRPGRWGLGAKLNQAKVGTKE